MLFSLNAPSSAAFVLELCSKSTSMVGPTVDEMSPQPFEISAHGPAGDVDYIGGFCNLTEAHHWPYSMHDLH